MTNYALDKTLKDLKEGEFKSTGKRFSDVSSDGGSVGVLIDNLDGFDLYVPAITVRSEFAGRVEKGFNASVDESAENLEFTNKKSSGPDSDSEVNVFSFGDGEPGDVSLEGDNFSDKYLPAGDAISPGTQQEVGGNIVASGDNLAVRVVNESGSDGSVSIDVDFIRMTDI